MQLFAKVEFHYKRMDHLTAQTAAVTPGLGCPPGCGACCTSPTVEATEVELLPMAAMLVREGRAQEALSKLEQAEAQNDPLCVMFERISPDGRLGRCSAYEHRPGICRLMGFSGRISADGTAEWCPCKVMRESTDDAAQALAKPPPKEMPIISHELSKLRSTSGYASEQAPLLINDALKRALSKELMRTMYSDLQSDDKALEDSNQP